MAAPTITATPNPVVFPFRDLPGNVEETTVKWDTGTSQRGKVYVSVNGAAEVQFDGGKNGLTGNSKGKKQAVQDGQTLEFRLRTAAAATLLAKVKVTTERPILPQAVIDAIRSRPPAAQGIYSLNVVPGVETVVMTFRTRQPTNPFVEIFNDETGELADYWARPDKLEVHHMTFDGMTKLLAQNTRYRYRINAHAVPGSADPRDAEATGFFWTGSRAATVLFDRIHVRNDGDPGTAGDFRFTFGAGDAATGADLGNIESWGEGAIDAGQDVDVNRIIEIPSAPRGIWAQVNACEDDALIYWPTGLCLIGMKPSFAVPGSFGVESEACAAATVTAHFDIGGTLGGTAETPFQMVTGDFVVAFDVFGRLRVTAQNGYWHDPAALWDAKAKERALDKVSLLEPMKRVRPRPITTGVAAWRASRAHAAMVTADGQTHKVLLGPGGAVYHQAFGANASHAGLTSLGGQFAEPVTAVATAAGRVSVFGLSPDGAVLYKTRSPDARLDEEWRHLGGRFIGAVTATPGSDTTIELFARSEDGSVFHLMLPDPQKDELHGEWEEIGAGAEGALAAHFSVQTGLSLFAIGRGGEILHKRRQPKGKWQPTNGEWERLGVASEGLISAEWVAKEGLLLAVVSRDETVRVLAWPDYPEAPPRDDWKVIGTINSLLNGEIAPGEASRKARGVTIGGVSRDHIPAAASSRSTRTGRHLPAS